LENSILWDNITVGRAASITNSIVASGANIEDKACLDGQTINYDAPAQSGGK
jgi:NDP-sugar pyrophosphorylase family protein